MRDYLKDNPWAEAYTWLWYNDEEIFNYTQEDWDNKAKELHERGVTIALSFSLTHFRIGYYPYWKEINECIRKMVIACHKYGIKLVEHHSTHLTLNLLTDSGWERLDGDLIAYGAGVCSRDNWKRIFPYLTVSRTVEGKFLPDLAQIDGSTGELATNMYGAYSLCFNNPDYREVYFNYVKDVVNLGIDGIMNDDVQFFGDMKACTCKHCRKLFKEQTGYDIPDPEHWDEFFENYDNPAYIAWKKFKFDSTTRMYRDLTELYDDMGVKLLRPNYSSDVLMYCPTSYSFDRCMDLWTAIFQENCFSSIIKQSFLHYYTEAIHRYAAGRRHNVPSMSMFYPDREDTTYFGWALARSWGQLYNGTCEGMDITPLEKPYRDFERENMRFYTAPDKIADLSFYFSQKTRDYTDNAMVSYMHKCMGGMQSAYVSCLSVDMVFETDDVEELMRHKTVVLSHVAMVSDDEISRFAEFVRRGGRLIILGDFALFNEDGSARDEDAVQAAFGIKFEMDKAVKSGDGEILRLSFVPSESEYQPAVWCWRRVENPTPQEVVPSKWKMQNEGTGAVLTSIIEPKLKIECANDRVVLTGYVVDGGLALHVVNLANTIAEKSGKTDHTEIITNFTPDGEKLPAAKLTVKLPDGMTVSRAILKTPEHNSDVILDISISEDAAVINVPSGLFSGYALIAVE